MLIIKRIFNSDLLTINAEQTLSVNRPYFTIYGWFLLITYPGFYYYNQFFAVSEGTEFINLRLFIGFLGVLLITRKWHLTLWRKYEFFVWNFTLFISLPFFFMFLLLNNHDSNIWQINGLFSLIILSVFTKPLGFFLFFIFGFISAYAVTAFIDPSFIYPEHLNPVLQTYAAMALYFAIYSQRKKIIEKDKRVTLQSSAATIAHEMRTPLARVSMNSIILNKQSQAIRKELDTHGVSNDTLNSSLEEIEDIGHSLSRISKNSHNLINILLRNLKEDFQDIKITTLSAQKVITDIKDEYVLQPEEQEKLHISIQEDFMLKGNPDLLKHIFFNLLKNSLYFIHASDKGEIYISAQSEDHHNLIIFKDTGPGIPNTQLPHLFKPFHSKRPHGTGLGLSFCKKAMKSMGGDITVDSTLGEHTTFTLSFPKIKENMIV